MGGFKASRATAGYCFSVLFGLPSASQDFVAFQPSDLNVHGSKDDSGIGKDERLAVRTGAAQHGLVIIVAHGVFVSERFEEWRVVVLHVEELHGLPGVTRRAAGGRTVGGVDRRLEIMETTCRVVLRNVLRVDGAIHLLDHLEVLMDGVAGVGVKRQVQPGQLKGTW